MCGGVLRPSVVHESPRPQLDAGEVLWALFLLKTGDKRPITTALNNLQGEFFVNNNLIAAGALVACIPPILVYIVLQKQFISGLTLGSTKG